MKQITFNINPKDIRFVLKTIITRIVEREANKQQRILTNLDEQINESQCDEIIKNLQQLIAVKAESAVELSELGVLVELIRPTDAEVLKDSLDLEENSLGVNGGGE